MNLNYICNPFTVSNFFIEKALASGNKISLLQCNMLCVISYGYTAAILDEKLFLDSIYTWTFGPVVENLYNNLKDSDFSDSLDKPILSHNGILDKDNDYRAIVQMVWDKYSNLYTSSLINDLTAPNTPWRLVYDKYNIYTKIPYYRFKEYYSEHISNSFDL